MLGRILLTVWFIGACLVLWFLPPLIAEDKHKTKADVAFLTAYCAAVWFVTVPAYLICLSTEKFVVWRLSHSNRTKSLQKPSNSQDVV